MLRVEPERLPEPHVFTFFEARARLLAHASVLPSELVSLDAAHGRVLAEALVAETPVPPFDCSATDGCAVSADDVNAVMPAALGVSGVCRAGDAPVEHVPGRAWRIFTGASLPRGADAVILQESSERDGDVVRFTRPARPFENVRRAGEDIAAGAVALPPGTRLGPFQLGVAAALDRPRLRLARRPRGRIVATGDELRPVGSPPMPGQIPESNTAALRAMAVEAGADAYVEPPIADDLDTARQRLAACLQGCDVLVTIGGASVGDYDLVRPALQLAGGSLSISGKWRSSPASRSSSGARARRPSSGYPAIPCPHSSASACSRCPCCGRSRGTRGPSRRRSAS